MLDCKANPDGIIKSHLPMLCVDSVDNNMGLGFAQNDTVTTQDIVSYEQFSRKRDAEDGCMERAADTTELAIEDTAEDDDSCELGDSGETSRNDKHSANNPECTQTITNGQHFLGRKGYKLCVTYHALDFIRLADLENGKLSKILSSNAASIQSKS